MTTSMERRMKAEKIKLPKKEPRIEVYVSRVNFNRVKFGTHTIQEVLKREGYKLDWVGDSVETGGNIVPVCCVDLKPKELAPPSLTEVSNGSKHA